MVALISSGREGLRCLVRLRTRRETETGKHQDRCDQFARI
jgi:hypothetical protein